jgi:hypothetical protein
MEILLIITFGLPLIKKTLGILDLVFCLVISTGLIFSIVVLNGFELS